MKKTRQALSGIFVAANGVAALFLPAFAAALPANPATSDNTGMFKGAAIILAVVAAAILIILAFTGKKKDDDK